MEGSEIQYSETNFSKADWPVIKAKGIETGLFTFGQGKREEMLEILAQYLYFGDLLQMLETPFIYMMF